MSQTNGQFHNNQNGGEDVPIPLTHSLTRSVDPSLEPITVADVKQHLGIPSATTGFNTQLTNYIKAAREVVERDTRRAFISQTWVHKQDDFPNTHFIELGKPPLLTVTSLQYVASTGNTVTWASTNYEVDTNRTPGVLYLKYNVDWPSNVRDIQNAVTVTFTAGFGTTRSNVPERAKQAVRLLVDDWFCNRSIDGPANRENYMALIHTLRWGDYR